MHHTHLDKISSTQSYLTENINELSHPTLISCDQQTKGKGQYDRIWHSFDGTVCFSFTWEAASITSLTSLEIGFLITQFIKAEYNIETFLKWPNDILDSKGHKLGGILIHNTRSSYYVVGVGFNLFSSSSDTKQKFKNAFLFNTPQSKKSFCSKLYNYILKNRISSNLITDKWTKRNLYHNKRVRLVTKENEIIGTFNGIQNDGAILINQKAFYSGSLFIAE